MLDANNALKLLLDMLAFQRDGILTLSNDITMSEWTDERIKQFEALKLLNKTSPAKSVLCSGCEEQCLMPVTYNYTLQPPRAFVICDMRDDIGLVRLSPEELIQWQLTTQQLAQCVASLCGLSQTVTAKGQDWYLGKINGNKHQAQAYLTIQDQQCYALVAGHQTHLIELLQFVDDQLTIDIKRLKKMADSPLAKHSLQDETAEQRGERLLARKEALKKIGIRNFNEVMAEEENIDVSMIKKLISNANERRQDTVNRQKTSSKPTKTKTSSPKTPPPKNKTAKKSVSTPLMPPSSWTPKK